MTEHTAVVDRIERATAVATLLIEDENGAVIDQRVIDLADVPEEARYEGAVVRVAVAETELTIIEHQPAETTARRDRLRDRFDALAERPPNSKEDT